MTFDAVDQIPSGGRIISRPPGIAQSNIGWPRIRIPGRSDERREKPLQTRRRTSATTLACTRLASLGRVDETERSEKSDYPGMGPLAANASRRSPRADRPGLAKILF